MAVKKIAYDQEARERIRDGVRKLARAVKVTLGPRGRNVIIEKSFGSPTVTKDGVTVAKEVELEGKYENMGAQLVREVASKTSDVAGDGTTTATILAEAIFEEGLKNVTAGANPVAIKRGIEKAVAAVVKELKAKSTKVAGKKEIAQVGCIAANNDEQIGKILGRRHGARRAGWRDHGRGRQEPRYRGQVGRRHAVRQGLLVAALRHQRGQDGVRAREPVHPRAREEGRRHQGHAAAARKDRAERSAAAGDRRGSRGRSPGDPGGQQAARHLQVRRGEGTWLR
jgi:hypothetical protein